MKTRILLLEDDLLLVETLADLLEEAGFSPQPCRTGQEALELTYAATFDLYLLDINVPLINGVTLLSELREAGDTTPAIFLTSSTDKPRRKAGFESGADDFITKPFDHDELLWRIRALLRRSGVPQACFGGLCLDEETQTILLDECQLELTKKEFDLLALLMRNASKTVTKEMIVEVLWPDGEAVSEGALRVYVNRLKHRIGAERIQNIRGVGYRLVS